MKKLLSLLSVLTISGTALPTTIAASLYQKEEILNSDINNLLLKRVKRENNKNLPIANVGNWDLTTAEGYFKYLGWVIRKKQPSNEGWNWDNYNEVETIDVWNYDSGFGKMWLESNIEIVNNFGFINENSDKIINNTTLLNESKNYLKNDSNSERKMLTSNFSYQQTTTKTITIENTNNINLSIIGKIGGADLNFEFKNSTSWAETASNTYTAPSQEVNVPANSILEVNYQLFKQEQKLNNGIIWSEINPNQKFEIAIISKEHIYKFYDSLEYKFSEFINIIKKNNLNWILNIPNAFLQEKNNKIMARIKTFNYLSALTVFHVVIKEPKKSEIT